MTLAGIGFIIFAMLGMIAMYSPGYLLEDCEHMSGKELGHRHPQFAWMRFGYPAMVLAVFATAVWFGGAYAGKDDKGLYAFGAALYAVTLLNGVVGLITGVCPFFDKFRYSYVRDKNVSGVGFKLIVFGVLGLVGSLLLPMVLPSVKIF